MTIQVKANGYILHNGATSYDADHVFETFDALVGQGGNQMSKPADSMEEALRRVLLGDESTVTLSEECQTKLAVEAWQELGPTLLRIREESRSAYQAMQNTLTKGP